MSGALRFSRGKGVSVGKDGGASALAKLRTFSKCVLGEYVWLDADGVTRSKTMTMTARPPFFFGEREGDGGGGLLCFFHALFFLFVGWGVFVCVCVFVLFGGGGWRLCLFVCIRFFFEGRVFFCFFVGGAGLTRKRLRNHFRVSRWATLEGGRKAQMRHSPNYPPVPQNHHSGIPFNLHVEGNLENVTRSVQKLNCSSDTLKIILSNSCRFRSVSQ